MYENNLIGKELGADDIEIIAEHKKAPGWLPVTTYDMVQCGYPYPNHGEMIVRPFHGCNKDGELYPGGGMWCKAEDIRKIIEPDSLQGENNHLKTVLHNVINTACFGNDYYNALYNIIKLVSDALPDYETHRQHGVLKPNNLSTSNPTGEPVKE